MNDFIPSQNIFNITFSGFYSSLHFTLPRVLTVFLCQNLAFARGAEWGLGLPRSVPSPHLFFFFS